MEMPEYYRSHREQKLWRMAARWIAENNPNLGGYSADRCAPIMELLDLAGAADVLEDGPLPSIVWPPPDLPKRAILLESDTQRKRVASASFLNELKRMAGGE